MKFIILLMVMCSFVRAQSVSDVQKAVFQVDESLSHRVSNPVAIVQYSFRGNDKFRELELLVKSEWRDGVYDYIETNPTENEQAIYFKAMQSLPVKEYIAFLHLVMSDSRNSKIKLYQLKWMLFPSSKHLRGVWYEQKNDPNLKQVALLAGKIFNEDEHMVAFFKKASQGLIGNPEPNSESNGENRAQKRYRGDVDGNKLDSGSAHKDSSKTQQIESISKWPIIVALLFFVGAFFWWITSRKK